MRKKPRGQHNARRGERKKNNMAQVARTKMYQKAKNRGNRKKSVGNFKEKKGQWCQNTQDQQKA